MKPSGSSTTSAKGEAPTSTRRSKTALAMIQDTSRPSYVLFLTDGLPTAGETARAVDRRELPPGQLAPRRASSASVSATTSTPGCSIGLSGGNSGTSEYVKPDEDIEAHVGRFYSKMTSPVLADIRVELAGIDINRTYPRDIPDLFEGGQIVWAGRYRQSGRTTIRVTRQGRRRAPESRIPGRAGRLPSQGQATTSSSGSGPSAGSAT